MNLDSRQLIDLLRDVERIRMEHELTARLTGENFNVFKILRLSSAEVRTHSAFLAELLNPEGSHGQGTTYLDLFLKKINIGPDVFTAEGSKVKVEFFIGVVNLEEHTGGRIDIFLKDRQNRHIVIENKIYAADQENQLLRYHNAYPNAHLYYLTLNGNPPSDWSKGDEDYSVISISYKEHILGWLDDCHKASVSLPVVRETILQYENLIRILTNQTTGDKMIEEAKKVILAHPEMADAITLLGDALQKITWETKDKLTKQIKTILPYKDDYELDNGITIIRDCGDDRNDGFWVGFRATRGQEPIPSADATQYGNILRGLEGNGTFASNDFWNIGWFNPKLFGHRGSLENLPKSLILSLHSSETEFMAFVDNLRNEVEGITEKLLEEIRALK